MTFREHCNDCQHCMRWWRSGVAAMCDKGEKMYAKEFGKAK